MSIIGTTLRCCIRYVARPTCRRTALLSNSKISGPSAMCSSLLLDVSSPPSSAPAPVLLLFCANKRTHVYVLVQPPHVRHLHCHDHLSIICVVYTPLYSGCEQRIHDVAIAWAQQCHHLCRQRHQMSLETFRLRCSEELGYAMLLLGSDDLMLLWLSSRTKCSQSAASHLVDVKPAWWLTATTV